MTMKRNGKVFLTATSVHSNPRHPFAFRAAVRLLPPASLLYSNRGKTLPVYDACHPLPPVDQPPTQARPCGAGNRPVIDKIDAGNSLSAGNRSYRVHHYPGLTSADRSRAPFSLVEAPLYRIAVDPDCSRIQP